MLLKDFTYLPKSDRRAILFLSGLAFVIAAIIGGFAAFDDTKDRQPQAASASHTRKTMTAENSNSSASRCDAKLFYFDPNTADSTKLARLGIEPWQIRNIMKYRRKGGVYRQKEDFAYVYGMTVRMYRRLAPYIRIAYEYQPASSLPEVRNRRYSSYTHGNETRQDGGNTKAARYSEREGYTVADKGPTPYQHKIHKGEHIAVNLADTTMLKKIPGIGSYYARQTVRYRNLLGGFVSEKQLLEIDGFPTEALEYIKIDRENVKKLYANRMSLSQLRRHPYINYYQARAITDYRRLHGTLSGIKDLEFLNDFSAKDIARLQPYLDFSK